MFQNYRNHSKQKKSHSEEEYSETTFLREARDKCIDEHRYEGGLELALAILQKQDVTIYDYIDVAEIYHRTGSTDLAIKAIDICLEKWPSESESPQVMLTKAYLLSDQSKYSAAIDCLESINELLVDDDYKIMIALYKGSAYQKMGMVLEAMKQCQLVLEKQPENGHAAAKLAEILAANKDIDFAIELLKTSIKVRTLANLAGTKETEVVMHLLAQLLSTKGNLEEAGSWAVVCVGCNPANPYNHLLLIKVAIQNGDIEGARVFYSHFRSLFSDEQLGEEVIGIAESLNSRLEMEVREKDRVENAKKLESVYRVED